MARELNFILPFVVHHRQVVWVKTVVHTIC